MHERAEHRDTADQHPLVVLVLAHQPPGHIATHLAALLQRSTPLGLTALILGHWAPATLTIHNHRVTGTHGNPNLAYLVGTRMFHIPHNRATELWSRLARQQIAELPPDGGQAAPSETAPNR